MQPYHLNTKYPPQISLWITKISLENYAFGGNCYISFHILIFLPNI